ncbi:MAG TPA: hypothetical protein VG847_10560 [Chitinophagaceae bacterium]|nr:hypothetical protein [Chitinophagaceae bacterium]
MNNFSIALSEEAELEALQSYYWYEKEKSGLGEEFKKFLDLKVRLIQQNPKASQ